MNMLMKLRLHNVSEFITSKSAPLTFLRKKLHYKNVAKQRTKKTLCIYLIIIYLFSDNICVTDYISSVIKEY